MTIELQAQLPAIAQHPDGIVRFVFGSAIPPGLLTSARALLDAAPRELAESFEQALRNGGLAS